MLLLSEFITFDTCLSIYGLLEREASIGTVLDYIFSFLEGITLVSKVGWVNEELIWWNDSFWPEVPGKIC